jgi:hypothetical protein
MRIRAKEAIEQPVVLSAVKDLIAGSSNTLLAIAMRSFASLRMTISLEDL